MGGSQVEGPPASPPEPPPGAPPSPLSRSGASLVVSELRAHAVRVSAVAKATARRAVSWDGWGAARDGMARDIKGFRALIEERASPRRGLDAETLGTRASLRRLLRSRRRVRLL